MLQGSRTAHRRWWLSRRFNLFDGKWSSGDFAKKFVEIKCDFGAIDDTFSAVAGANAYFGYQINNITFGDGAKDGGSTYEYVANEFIPWKLYKNIQIGDPIGIYGSTDMVELNLMGLSKNLASISFRFGNNADLSNKLERLYLSIPDELLFANATYKVYADDEEGTVNRKTAFEKLKIDYPTINESDFYDNGKYPTSENNFDATDLESPDFYRSPIKTENEDGEEVIGTYVYLAKTYENIRNFSCTDLSFDNLDKLQELKVAGYMGLKTLNLSKNKFINSVDARYSNIGSITFAEGSRIKEIKVSDNFTDLVLPRCSNITLDNIMVNATPLKNNSGVTISKIVIENSDGLNHDDSFKDFILNWIKGGSKFKPNYSRSLSLKGIAWENMRISDIEAIINFAETADSCEISGVISMGANNLSKSDFELIENVFKKTPGIDVVVKIPYPNILIEVQPSMVAGQEITLSSILYSDIDYNSSNYSLEYTFIEETNDEEAENSFFDGKSGKRYVKISDSNIRNNSVKITNPIAKTTTIKTNEILLGEDTNTLLAVIFSYEGTTKFDIASLEIKDPTYATGVTINGNTMLNEVNKSFVYDLSLISNKNDEPIGSFEITWEITGTGVNHISHEITNNNRTLVVHTNSTPDETELLSELEINVKVSNKKAGETKYGTVTNSLEIYLLNENIVLTDKTNDTVMNVCYENRWATNKQYITKAEVESIEDIGVAFKNITQKEWSFEEFKYFTNPSLTRLTDEAFANSKLKTITFPDNVTELGNGVFKNCKQLKSVKMSENVSILSEGTFLNCSNLDNFILPKSVIQINKNAFGGVGFNKIVCYNDKSNGFKTLYIYADSMLSVIKNDAFEIDKWSYDKTTNALTEVYLPSKLIISEQQYNFLLSRELCNINLPNIDETTLRFENNILYGDKLKTKVVRGLPKSDNIIDVLDLDIVDEVYEYAFYNCNTIKKLIFNETLASSFLRKGAFIQSKIEEIDLSRAVKLERMYDYTFYDMPNLKTILFPENGMLKEMGTQMFYNSSKLEILELPDTISVFKNNTGDTYSSYFINNCGIKVFKLPQSLTNCGRNTITNCKNLEEFTFSDYFKFSSTTEMVQNCPKLKILNLPLFSKTLDNGNYEVINNSLFNNNDTFMYETFISCPSIEEFRLHNMDNKLIMTTTDNGKSIIRVGNGNLNDNSIITCEPKLVKAVYSLTEYVLADDIKEIEGWAFAYCGNLMSLMLNLSLQYIGHNAFAFTKNLDKIVLPDTLNSIGAGAFRGSNIEEIIIPEQVDTINQYAFNGCANLSKVTILSESLKYIDQFAFNDCANLKEIIILTSSAPEIKSGNKKFGDGFLDNNPLDHPRAYVYHPFGYDKNNIVGKNITDKKVLKVPYNSTGYNVYKEDGSMNNDKWAVPLLTPKHCNFKLENIILENDITICGEVLNNIDMVYVKYGINNNVESVPLLTPYDEWNTKRIVLFKSENIYHGDIISIYSDENCENKLGEVKVKFNQSVYSLDANVIMRATYLNANQTLDNNIEMANITKHEYDLLLSKINLLMKLLNNKK
jgi:hypothetical protein